MKTIEINKISPLVYGFAISLFNYETEVTVLWSSGQGGTTNYHIVEMMVDGGLRILGTGGVKNGLHIDHIMRILNERYAIEGEREFSKSDIKRIAGLFFEPGDAPEEPESPTSDLSELKVSHGESHMGTSKIPKPWNPWKHVPFFRLGTFSMRRP